MCVEILGGLSGPLGFIAPFYEIFDVIYVPTIWTDKGLGFVLVDYVLVFTTDMSHGDMEMIIMSQM